MGTPPPNARRSPRVLTASVSAGYGTVVELRINSGGKLPNFGFVVFDDAEPVQKVLSNRVRARPTWAVEEPCRPWPNLQ